MMLSHSSNHRIFYFSTSRFAQTQSTTYVVNVLCINSGLNLSLAKSMPVPTTPKVGNRRGRDLRSPGMILSTISVAVLTYYF